MLLRALEKIVEQINHDRYILPGTELSIEHRFVKRKDSFSASKLCKRRVSVVFCFRFWNFFLSLPLVGATDLGHH